MKKKYAYFLNGKKVERELNYIPVRYIIAGMITLFEVLAIIGIVIALCYFVPYFYILAFLTEIACVITIIASNDNPDYKVPWLLFVLILPVAGFMLYFIFYSRKLKRKYVKRLKDIKDRRIEQNDDSLFNSLSKDNLACHNQAKMLCQISDSHLFTNTETRYFKLGEEMFASMLDDLNQAKSFIFMEYFIIEEGRFWDSILEILKQKAANGVEVKLVYDDIGCMSTLPGNYDKILKKYGISAVPFSRLKGNADSEFNNRSHRKITVIDGVVGYTGGINIADEYINEVVRFGHWKDVGVRLKGDAVKGLTELFLTDYFINVKDIEEPKNDYYPKNEASLGSGYIIPFGDGPRPVYARRVGQSLIRDMVLSAKKYVYITTPYLIIDNELCLAIETAALKGVDVRIVVPHIPDKKLIFGMTKSFYQRFIDSGVKIYEYEPGFIHAKTYIVDGDTAMVGTINLDYRSLVHHFENGVWMYKTDCITDIKDDFDETFNKSILIEKNSIKVNLIQRLIRSIVRIFAPML